MQTELESRPQAMIAMSGGVDSSVAAYLMQQAGYACMGATMRLYENEDAGLPRGSTCCALDDVEDAHRVAYTLGMPHYVFNYKDAFREQVMARFAAAYQRGATPNPCLDCNRYLKFGLLESRARALGCDVLATGHYARIEQLPDGHWTLKKAADPEKDQSYVLAWLTQEQLAHTRFPLGGLRKSEARAIAEAHGFCNAHKHDSQDICFVPDGDYAAAASRGALWTRTGTCSARTAASSTIRSGSAAGSASRPKRRCTSAASTCRTTRSCSDAMPTCFRPSSMRAAATGSPATCRSSRCA